MLTCATCNRGAVVGRKPKGTPPIGGWFVKRLNGTPVKVAKSGRVLTGFSYVHANPLVCETVLKRSVKAEEEKNDESDSVPEGA